MLKIKSNIKNFKVRYKPIIFGENSVIRGDDEHLIIPLNGDYNIHSPEAIVFIREDGSEINYFESRIIVDESGNDRTVVGFPDVRIKIDSCEIISKKIRPNQSEVKFLVLNLSERHYYLKNRDDVFVNDYIDCTFQGDFEIDKKRCDGDYVIYNDYFLFKARGTSNGEYNLRASTLENYETYVYLEVDGEVKALNAIVPCGLGGLDMVNTIFLYGDDALIDKIYDNPTYYNIYGEDERFFTTTIDSGRKIFHSTPGTTVNLRLGDVRLTLPFSLDFDTSLLQEEAVSQFAESESSGMINEVIDYEKQQFIPVYDEKDVEKIVFCIHLRQRDENSSDWSTNDQLEWNCNINNPRIGGDSVSYLGFDDEDVYYQKKMVSETFLRVSFYDKPDRKNQKLLYTAKIFLNSADLYGEYIEDKSLSGIETKFVCTNKYDYDNSTEGFYIHLFPSHLEDGIEGEIYMKCELNNAKYGKTVPLVIFSDDGVKRGYMIKDPNFLHVDGDLEDGIPAQNSNGDDYTPLKVDMATFYEDVYTKVHIGKNTEKKRYEWEISKNSYDFIYFDTDDSLGYGKNALVLQLYEPRINYPLIIARPPAL